ncbi:hypothetical protein AXX17_AT2G44220 [Arabidopsis thaliana]|uniref:Uncharacterized protein n=1 Tax=Arabidopsis thaliana TaxID=3702 RepID=A0A178VZT4_ARATH|nr:hypothetical protein AXX17_AT2G44220 [Arabidopsis thaliana]
MSLFPTLQIMKLFLNSIYFISYFSPSDAIKTSCIKQYLSTSNLLVSFHSR